MKKNRKIILALAAIVAGVLFIPKFANARKQERLADLEKKYPELVKTWRSFKAGSVEAKQAGQLLNKAKQEIAALKAELGLA